MAFPSRLTITHYSTSPVPTVICRFVFLTVFGLFLPPRLNRPTLAGHVIRFWQPSFFRKYLLCFCFGLALRHGSRRTPNTDMHSHPSPWASPASQPVPKASRSVSPDGRRTATVRRESGESNVEPSASQPVLSVKLWEEVHFGGAASFRRFLLCFALWPFFLFKFF